jgi:hypothetical protein
LKTQEVWSQRELITWKDQELLANGSRNVQEVGVFNWWIDKSSATEVAREEKEEYCHKEIGIVSSSHN